MKNEELNLPSLILLTSSFLIYFDLLYCCFLLFINNSENIALAHHKIFNALIFKLRA